MPNRNQLIFGRRLIYELKKRYGEPADLYHIQSVIDDSRSGRTVITKVKFKIRKAVLLPVDVMTSMNVPGGFRPVTTLFPSQQLDISSRIILIDNRDLPKDFEVTTKDYLIINDERYNIKSIENLAVDIITALNTSLTPGSDKEEIFDSKIKESILLIEDLIIAPSIYSTNETINLVETLLETVIAPPNPPNLANLISWHDPSNIETLFTSSGSAGFPYNSTGPYSSLSSNNTDFNTGGGGPFAWAGWINFATLFSSSLQAVVSKGGDSGSDYEWVLYINYPTVNQVSFFNYTLAGGSLGFVTWTNSISSETWYFVAAWRDTLGNINLNINNGITATVATSGATTSGPALFRVSGVGVNNPFFGNIGPHGYWSRALTNSDLTALYNNGTPLLFVNLLPTQKSNLVAYYDCNSLANLINDQTGNGHTLTNTATILGSGVIQTAIDGVSNQQITQWNDRTTNNHKYIAPSGNTGLVFNPNVQNSLPMLLGDELTRLLSCDELATLLSGNEINFGLWIIVKNLVLNNNLQTIFLSNRRIINPGDPVIEIFVDTKWNGEERNDAGAASILSNGTLDSNCHLLGLVGDSTNLSLYLDNTLLGQTPRLTGMKTLDIWTLGMHRNINHDQASSASNGFSGAIGEVLLYNDATDPRIYLIGKWGI